MTYHEFFPMFIRLLMMKVKSRVGEVDRDIMSDFLLESVWIKDMCLSFEQDFGEEMPYAGCTVLTEKYLSPTVEEYLLFRKRRLMS